MGQLCSLHVNRVFSLCPCLQGAESRRLTRFFQAGYEKVEHVLDVRNIIEQHYSFKALKHTLLTNKVKKKRHLNKVKRYSLVQTIEGAWSNHDSESDTGSVKDSRDDISVILKQHGKALP